MSDGDGSEAGVESLDIVCETLSYFESASFPKWGGTRNAIMLPQEVFDENDWLEEFGYARAIAGHSSQDPSAGSIVQVAGFSESHDTGSYHFDGSHSACARSTMQDRIGIDLADDDGAVRLFPYSLRSIHDLKVERVMNVEQENLDIVT